MGPPLWPLSITDENIILQYVIVFQVWHLDKLIKTDDFVSSWMVLVMWPKVTS